MTWDYGTLASEVYELDKPIGHSFGDVEFYTRAPAGTRRLRHSAASVTRCARAGG